MSSGDGVILVEIKAKSAKLELELGLSLAIAQKVQQLTTEDAGLVC